MMWQLEQAATTDQTDLKRFLDTLNAHASYFDSKSALLVARAPGRLDLMGGIADYSGALVLQLPLAAATFVAAQLLAEPVIEITSLAADAIGGEQRVSIPLDTLTPVDGPRDYAEARALLGAERSKSWAAYVAGALVVLQHEKGLRPARGVRLLIASDVPAGKGVSSSAAIEVAAMQAICATYGQPLDGREMALLCQKVENLVVGAPCGVMDQMTAACGAEGRLLALLCQPAELQPAVDIPPEVEVWGIDSGIRHAVSGADYSSVRVGAFMGYRIIAGLAGIPVTPDGEGRVAIADRRWQGYLANIAPSEWETLYRDRVPEQISGAAFLARCGGTTDRVTTIDPARTYAVRVATAHPIYEHQRVRLFRALLQAQPLQREHMLLLGELMYQSHASYSACGLGSGGTDRLVELVREAGPAAGLYGAKITGGGSGGTVAVLARRGAADVVHQVAEAYAHESGREALVLGGSSPGALQFGVRRVIWR